MKQKKSLFTLKFVERSLQQETKKGKLIKDDTSKQKTNKKSWVPLGKYSVAG